MNKLVNDTLMVLYGNATQLSIETKQVVGEKNNRYITLEQLERIIKEIQQNYE